MKRNYTDNESTVYMNDLQARLDRQKKTIKFTSLFIKTKPPSIAHVIGTALNMRDTSTVGGKKEHPQDLGSSRSFQDLYLIVKHYFPEATIFDVSAELKKRMNEKSVYCRGLCSTYNRYMFRKGTPYGNPDPILSRYKLI